MIVLLALAVIAGTLILGGFAIMLKRHFWGDV